MIAFFQGIWTWVTATYAGKIAASAFVSMLPLVELRAGLPIAVGLGLPPRVAMVTCVLANCVPIIPIIVFIKKIFAMMRSWSPKLEGLVSRLENKANKHRDVVEKYALVGLFILTAIPLPGTGAWTASLLAGLMDIRAKHAFLPIMLGVVAASIIMSVLSYGVAAVL